MVISRLEFLQGKIYNLTNLPGPTGFAADRQLQMQTTRSYWGNMDNPLLSIDQCLEPIKLAQVIVR